MTRSVMEDKAIFSLWFLPAPFWGPIGFLCKNWHRHCTWRKKRTEL